MDKDPICNAHHHIMAESHKKIMDIKEGDQPECRNIVYHTDNINEILESHNDVSNENKYIYLIKFLKMIQEK